MAVHRLYRFALDDASLAPALAIHAEGGGLPRRISTLAAITRSTVLADSPLSFLPGPTAADLGSWGGNASGSGLPSGTVLPWDPGVYSAAPSTYLAPGGGNIPAFWDLSTPWTIEFAVPGTAFASTSQIGGTWSNPDQRGLQLHTSSPNWFLNGSSSTGRGFQLQWDVSAAFPAWATDWALFALVYDGSRTADGFRLYANGVEARRTGSTWTLQPGEGIAGGSGWLWGLVQMVGFIATRYSVMAIWDRALTAASVAAHSGMPLGGPLSRARFTRAFPTAATVRGLLVPGDTALVAGSRGTRAYLSVDGGSTRAEVGSGADPALAVSAGQTLTVDVELSQFRATPTVVPYLATDAGGGPAVVYEEADPSPPAPVIIEPLAITVQDRTALAATVDDRTRLTVIVED